MEIDDNRDKIGLLVQCMIVWLVLENSVEHFSSHSAFGEGSDQDFQVSIEHFTSDFSLQIPCVHV